MQISHPTGNGVVAGSTPSCTFSEFTWKQRLLRFLTGPRRWSGSEPRSSSSAASSPVHPLSASPLTGHRCMSGESCSDSRRSCSTSLLTPPSTPPTSTAGRRRATISSVVTEPYGPSKQRFSLIPRRARLSTSTAVRSGPTGRTSARRSPCGTQATCAASPPTRVGRVCRVHGKRLVPNTRRGGVLDAP